MGFGGEESLAEDANTSLYYDLFANAEVAEVMAWGTPPEALRRRNR